MRMLVFIFCLASCAEPPQLRPLSSSVAITNRVLYGIVQKVEASERYLMNDTCAQRGALCDLAKQTARETEMAAVDVMGTGSANLAMQVLVLKSRVKKNDIIQYRIPPPGQDGFPAMIGTQAETRRAGVCDWLDGTPGSYTGGVVCNGWSYKSLRTKL
jgi:hypothetical protein